jgi:hypothetical protein
MWAHLQHSQPILLVLETHLTLIALPRVAYEMPGIIALIITKARARSYTSG